MRIPAQFRDLRPGEPGLPGPVEGAGHHAVHQKGEHDQNSAQETSLRRTDAISEPVLNETDHPRKRNGSEEAGEPSTDAVPRPPLLFLVDSPVTIARPCHMSPP